MNPKYTHDFSSALIKHTIEAEFYQKAGEVLSENCSASIVTGPDYQRHIDNFRKYISNTAHLRICEIDFSICCGIFHGLKDKLGIIGSKISVVNNSIEHFGSMFIDCDLTCISDIDVIKRTLLKQIEVQLTAQKKKVFILSVGLRDSNGSHKYHTILSPIFAMLGSQCISTTIKDNSLPKGSGMGLYKKSVRFGTSKSRIQDYKCYSYNAGGGPMLTCLIIYK